MELHLVTYCCSINLCSLPISLPDIHNQDKVPTFGEAGNWEEPGQESADVLSSHGELWNKWRSAFNSGFGPRNVTSRIPELLYVMQVFSDNLEKRAGKHGSWGACVPASSRHYQLDLGDLGCDFPSTRWHGTTAIWRVNCSRMLKRH
ncbi:hypothetical protein F5B18DRAFT_545779 [Nemania serpens]|nr:hypothetical protein F5B18DRAFT_545779 [Nemania serpens]